MFDCVKQNLILFFFCFDWTTTKKQQKKFKTFSFFSLLLLLFGADVFFQFVCVLNGSLPAAFIVTAAATATAAAAIAAIVVVVVVNTRVKANTQSNNETTQWRLEKKSDTPETYSKNDEIYTHIYIYFDSNELRKREFLFRLCVCARVYGCVWKKNITNKPTIQPSKRSGKIVKWKILWNKSVKKKEKRSNERFEERNEVRKIFKRKSLEKIWWWVESCYIWWLRAVQRQRQAFNFFPSSFHSNFLFGSFVSLDFCFWLFLLL